MLQTKYVSIPEMLFGLATKHAENKALIGSDGNSLSYKQLADFIAHVRSNLRDKGIHQDTRVALMMPPGIMMAATSLSVMCCSVLVPLNPDNTDDELSYLFSKHNIKLLVTITKCEISSKLLSKYGVERLDLREADLWNAQTTNLNHELCDTNCASIVLHTSGSTAKPKSVLLTHKQLLCSAQNLCQSLLLTDQDTCLSVMPPFHVGAIVDLLISPLLSGGKIIVAPDSKPETFWTLAQTHRPTWYQGVPTMLQAIVDTLENSHYRAPTPLFLRFIRTVSAYLPKHLEHDLKNVFNIPILQIYGMTEAAGVITSNPLSLQKESSVGTPAGPEIKIIQNDHEVPCNVIGEIMIRGDSVITSYDESDIINAINFDRDWFKTGDLGYFDTDGYLYLTGRLKEVINQGGEKISPIEIDQCALEFPGIKQAASFALPHNTLGEEVALAIVTEGESVNPNALKAHLKHHLSDYKCPRKIYQLKALPLTKGGKLKRHELPIIVDKIKTSHLSNNTSPTSDFGKIILSEWKKVIKQKDIYNEDNFFDLGGDSLSAATLMAALEKKFNIQIPTLELIDHSSLDQFITRMEWLVRSQSTADHHPNVSSKLEYSIQKVVESWGGKRKTPHSLITGFNTEGTLPPFFWCSQGRSEVSSLVEKVEESQPVYAMRSLSKIVKRHKRDNKSLASRYVDEILQLQPHGPYYVGGYSEGGRVAHCIAEQLEDLGEKVQLLCLYDTIIDRPYYGRVAAFHCLTGNHSPYGLFNKPSHAVNFIYRGNLSLYKYNCTHSECMDDTHISLFSEQLSYELKCARTDSLSKHNFPTTFHGSPQFSSYKRYLAVHTARLMRTQSEYSVRVVLKNCSDQVWKPTDHSGITLAARWTNLKRSIRFSKPGFFEFTHNIEPEQEITLNLMIQSPHKAGLKWLEIDLLEEGRGWFTPDGVASIRKLVWIRK